LASVEHAGQAQAILDFWFGAPGTPEYAGPRGIWFKKNKDFDEAIRAAHMEDYERARDDLYDGWMREASTSLALVIALDQFPRNLFRDDPRTFAADVQALSVGLNAVNQDFDKALPPHQSIFFYLPFEHSEMLEVQMRCADLIQAMPDFELKEGYLGYALRHLEIIQRFGRFPHRNKILGRESTPEEKEFLKQPNSGF